MHVFDFTYSHTLILNGLEVAYDIEIEARANFHYHPGRPGRRHHPVDRFAEPDEDPEIEIDSIEVEGHPADTKREPGAKPVWRVLAPSDPLWDKMEAYLRERHFRDMCDAAEGDRADARADHAYERRGEVDPLIGAILSAHGVSGGKIF